MDFARIASLGHRFLETAGPRVERSRQLIIETAGPRLERIRQQYLDEAVPAIDRTRQRILDDALPRLERSRQRWLDSSYATYWEVRHIVAPCHTDDFAGGSLAPVLLLPGVYETWQFLQPIADRLNQLGHPIHIIPTFGYNVGSIPAMAALAQSYLDEHDLYGVMVVAHSKGGLIAKHMMVTNDTSGRIARVIAVNTPFAGSPLARYAIRRVFREFAPTDVTVTTLGARIDVNARITSIYAEEDPIIPGGSELAGATNIRLPLIGHFRLLSSALVFEQIEAALADSAADIAAAADIAVTADATPKTTASVTTASVS
ncbi:MAG: alpha/beta hydrolase [Microbacteriaceae bacterium]|nr:alpha/beta hydrolase [Microbacteriaceae bacterium]